MTTIRENLPIFPLRQVLLPYAALPLHIFEQRYRTMVQDILGSDRRFGIVLAHPTIDDFESSPFNSPATLSIARVGTIAEVTETTPYSDGRYDLVCIGRNRYEILQTNQDQPYLRATVRLLDEHVTQSVEDTPDIVAALTEGVRTTLTKVINRHSALAKEEDQRATHLQRLAQTLPQNPVALAYIAIRLLPTASLIERQRLLELRSSATRLRSIRQHLRREARVADQLGQFADKQATNPDDTFVVPN